MGDRHDVKGYPTVKLFTAIGSASGKQESIEFEGRDLESMTTGLNDKLGTMRLSDGTLKEEAGRVAQCDKIVGKAMGTVNDDVLTALVAAGEGLSGAKKTHANMYVAVAKKVIAKGNAYLATEGKRLSNMINGNSVSPLKKTNFMLRRNVISAFGNWETV